MLDAGLSSDSIDSILSDKEVVKKMTKESNMLQYGNIYLNSLISDYEVGADSRKVFAMLNSIFQ